MKAIRNHDRYFALKDVAKNGFVLKYFANAFRETDGIGVTEAHDQVQNYGIKEEFDCNVVYKQARHCSLEFCWSISGAQAGIANP